MPRILRNYLISFAIIALFFLAVHIINRMVAEDARQPPPGQEAPRQKAPVTPPPESSGHPPAVMS